MSIPKVRFTEAETRLAHEEWGMNCGPGAIAAILEMTPDELRPHLFEFEDKGYTNPKLMYRILDGLGVKYIGRHVNTYGDPGHGLVVPLKPLEWPAHGLACVQWEGPWCAAGVPMRVRPRRTHWVAAHRVLELDDQGVFDLNCMHVGGWVGLKDWSEVIAPWLATETCKEATGGWHLTYSIEIKPEAPCANQKNSRS